MKPDLKTLRFTRLLTEHIPAILEIEQRVNGAAWSEQSFKNELDQAASSFLVALLDGKLVAYGGCWHVVDEAHVTTIAVDPNHRRLGIGERLMVALLETACDAGMTCSTLEVRASNTAAIAMYEKLGFRQAAVRKGYYPDNRENAIVMWLHGLGHWETPS